MNMESKYSLKSRRYILFLGCILVIFFAVSLLPSSAAQEPEFLYVELQKSVDQVNWSDIDGTLASGFTIPINSAVTYYYLDFKDLTTETNMPLSEGFYGFNLTSHPAGFYAYWAAKGVDASATPGTWQAHAWQIINGNAPTFYIHVDIYQDFTLIDGLLKDFLGENESLLRVNGDYPVGAYSYTGSITSFNGNNSDPIEVFFNFLDDSGYAVWVDDNYDSSIPGWGVTHFDSINDGINASVNGGVVNVKPGIYCELVKVDKPIILQSTLGNDYTTITDAGSTYSELMANGGQTIQITSNNVLINDFCIERMGYLSPHPIAAVGNYGASDISNVEIRYCMIESVYNCTYFSGVDNLTIFFNWFKTRPTEIALFLNDSEDFLIWKNNITDYNMIGVSLNNCNNGTLRTIGIHNKFDAGIVIEDCQDILITSANLLDNLGDGLYVNNSMDLEVRNSLFENNRYGVSLGENSVAYLHDNSYAYNVHNIYGAAKLGSNLTYSEIQAAIDAASVGEDINVYPGLFLENVVINKEVGIHGLYDTEDTMVDGGTGNATFYIARDNDVSDVVISGLKIIGGEHCLRTGRYRDISGLQILDCIIEEPNGGKAVFIDPHNYSDVPPIRNGTDLFSTPVTLQYNVIRGGVYYQFWSYELYGVAVSRQLNVLDNDIDAMFLNGSISVNIRGNCFHSLGMEYSSNILIKENVFENPWEERYGIYLWSVNETPPVKDVNIEHNTILGYSAFAVSSGISGQGIVIAGAMDITIEGNEITLNTDGIWITDDYENRNGDRCVGNVMDIIIRGNDIHNGQTGIKLFSNVNATSIIDNYIGVNGKGVWIHGSSDHILSGNSIIGNYYGIRLDTGSSNNLAYNNYFADNFIHAFDQDSTTNKWNVSLLESSNIVGGPYIGGNYWDDYTGDDLNGDSIGDTEIPYNCSGYIGNGGDFLPLINADLTPPEVEVIYPNGGEIVNDTVNIVWSASDDVDTNLSIDLEYSNDSGVIWYIISPNETNDGSYEWDISALSEGSQYLVKVTATDNTGNNNSDMSDGAFSIVRDFPGPEVILISPYKGYFYFFNVQKARLFNNNCFIIGHIVIDAEVISSINIEKVEFYIDDELMSTSYVGIDDVYSWEWDEIVLFYHVIKVVAYDMYGNTYSNELGVTIFNFNFIP